MVMVYGYGYDYVYGIMLSFGPYVPCFVKLGDREPKQIKSASKNYIGTK